jgi:lipooligosaccharide transport system permease protein
MTLTAPTARRTGTGRIRFRSITAVWLRHWVALARYWKITVTWILVEPAVALLAVGFGIGKLVSEVEGAETYAEFVTPGIIMGSAMFHALFETSWNAYHRIDNQIYETQLTTPISIFELTLGDVAWAVTRSLMTTVAVALFAVALGWMNEWTAIGILIPAILSGMVFGTMGFFFAANAPYTVFLSLVFTLVATPLFFFSGTFFPISVLPDWIEPVAWVMPLTPGVHIARGFATNHLELTHLWSGLYMVGLISVFWPIAVWLMKRRLIK